MTYITQSLVPFISLLLCVFILIAVGLERTGYSGDAAKMRVAYRHDFLEDARYLHDFQDDAQGLVILREDVLDGDAYIESSLAVFESFTGC